MKLYSVVINWNDDDAEEGTYGATVRAASSEEAEAMVRGMMLASGRDEGWIDADEERLFGICIECSEGAAWEASNMEAVIAGLLEWETQQGGYDAPCWQAARDLMNRVRAIGEGG